ncbi:MAG: (2Fe-2S) ferredoxin domain-containing protein, partial [Spirochaetales bacterium]|nr:(2Fe-2S) ferredoxin domain-containing protein [Spirochaetales bacterium]
MTANKIKVRTIGSVSELTALADDARKLQTSGPQLVYRISLGTCGLAAGTTPVLEAIETELQAQGKADQVEIIRTGCMGLCH